MSRSSNGAPVQGQTPTVIFLHLGKTAGWTLRRILTANVPSSQVMQLGNDQQSPSGFLSDGPIKTFAALPKDERGRPTLITGHMVWGIHEYVPRPSTYVSLLRRPLARALSGYSRALHTPTHRLHRAVTERGLDLAGFVRSGLSLEVDNSQTRAICGDTDTRFGECSRQMLETAKRNIEMHFSVTGLTERFDETLILLRSAFGWSKLRYVRANVTKTRTPAEAVPPKTVELIEEQNWLDCELYEWVADRFERAVGSSESFGADLRTLRRSNALYRPFGHLTYTYPKRVQELLSAKKRHSRASAS